MRGREKDNPRAPSFWWWFCDLAYFLDFLPCGYILDTSVDTNYSFSDTQYSLP
jgi:hypothetical protein